MTNPTKIPYQVITLEPNQKLVVYFDDMSSDALEYLKKFFDTDRVLVLPTDSRIDIAEIKND